MKIRIVAVGRLRRGPERDLVDDYLARAEKVGRGLGVTEIAEHEVEDRKGGGMAGEGALLLRAIGDQGRCVALDERGEPLTSPAFAQLVSNWAAQGVPDMACIIGGADGLAPEVLARADRTVSLGAMVWPHMLVRVMVAEQIYRGLSILKGTPYHRQ